MYSFITIYQLIYDLYHTSLSPCRYYLARARVIQIRSLRRSLNGGGGGGGGDDTTADHSDGEPMSDLEEEDDIETPRGLPTRDDRAELLWTVRFFC